jgi:hypothetical protein
VIESIAAQRLRGTFAAREGMVVSL